MTRPVAASAPVVWTDAQIKLFICYLTDDGLPSDSFFELRKEDIRAGVEAASRLGATKLCEDEGCPHHGTPHVCITRSPAPAAALDGGRPLPFDRDTLGRMVREAWVRWAQTQPSPKSSWLVPYAELTEPDKEADRQIGEAIARWTLIGDAAAQSMRQPPSSLEAAAALLREAGWKVEEPRCATCLGNGMVLERKCPTCNGTGKRSWESGHDQ